MNESMRKRYNRSVARVQAVRDAVEAADKIILDFSDGSNEETDWLTGEVARVFVLKALHPFTRGLFEADARVETPIVTSVKIPVHPKCDVCNAHGVYHDGIWRCPICNKEIKP
jgi:hypothetical protein